MKKWVVIEGEILTALVLTDPNGSLSKAFTLNEIRQKRCNCIQIRLDPTHSHKNT